MCEMPDFLSYLQQRDARSVYVAWVDQLARRVELLAPGESEGLARAVE